MLSDKLELNSVRALGRLELTSWEHIPVWAEIQSLLGKTCESMGSPVVVAAGGGGRVLLAPVATSACGSELGAFRRLGSVVGRLRPGGRSGGAAEPPLSLYPGTMHAFPTVLPWQESLQLLSLGFPICKRGQVCLLDPLNFPFL